jgi:DNA polymerase-3 subunit gamma/tau
VGGDAERCLQITGQLANQGYDIAHVARDLLLLLRDIVVAKVCTDPGDLLDLADEEKRDVQALAARSQTDDLVRLHQGFSQAFDEVIKSPQPRAALEMLLVRLARRPPLLPIDDLLGRLSALERRLSAPARPAAAPARPPPATTKSEFVAPDFPERSARPEPVKLELVRPAPAPPAAPPRVSAPSLPAFPEPAPALASAPAPAPVPSAPAVPRTPLPDAVIADFRAILERVRAARPELAAFLEHAAPLELTAEQIVLGWEPKSMFAAQASDKDALAALGRAAQEHFGRAPRITCEFDSERAKTLQTLALLDAAAREQKTRSALQAARQHPRIADAMEILGARLKDVKLAEG